MQRLAAAGLIVPSDIDPVDTHVPLDLTTVSFGEIGKIHSEWAVRHGHLLFQMALISSRLGTLKRERRLALSRFRAKYTGEYRTKTAAEDAFMETERAEKIDTEIDELEIQFTLLEGLEGSYRAWREAASREITRRTQEQAPRD